MNRTRACRPWQWTMLFLTLTILTGSRAFHAPAAAAEKVASALDWVPADVAFFSASMRQKELIEIIGRSKAWEKFKAIPSIQFVWTMAEVQLNQPGGQFDTVRQLFELPENQQLLDLGIDMVSHEMFVYGDQSFVTSFDLLLQTLNSAQMAGFAEGIRNAAKGKPQDDENDDDQAGRAILDALAKNLEVIKMPNLVIGFKITDNARAKTQLKRLEVLAGLALQQEPKFKERLKRVELADGDYLTMLLDGKLVPSWDEVEEEIKKLERKPGDYAQVFEKLKQLTLAVAIGVRGDYLLLSLGSSNDHLAAIGKEKPLAELPELAPVVAARGKRLTGISYLSRPMHSVLGTRKQDIDKLASFARTALPGTKLDEALQKRILADVEKFAQDVKPLVPEMGSLVQFSFFTDRGGESYTYDRSQNLVLDGSQRLDLLSHLGGTPLLAAVTRSKVSPQDYETLVRWIKTAYGYGEEVALQKMPEADKEKFKQFSEFGRPLAARFDNATRTMLIPALADGQTGIVLDAKIKSQQWHDKMPKSADPLPMFELGIVSGVTDAELLKKAVAEYKAIADAVVVKIREVDPKAIPADYKIPLPQTREVSSGTLYWYAFPGSGLDSQIAISAGLSKKVLAVSSSTKQAERLLAEKPLASEGALADTTRPLASASICDWAGTVDVIRPWIDWGIRYYGARAAAGAGGGLMAVDDAGVQKLALAEEDSDSTKAILDQVHTGLEILQTLRTITSVTYFENGVTVTHTETHWQDVK